MITYEEVLARLHECADEDYRKFHKKLLKNDAVCVLGVRMPLLRKLSKEWKGELPALLSFPDEYYEVTFLKCAVAARLPFSEFCTHIDGLVGLLDNWATCDCFVAPCIGKHRDEFLPYLRRYIKDEREFIARYALVTLLHFYVEEQYYPVIFSFAEECDAEKYYVKMAAAWLIAEVLVRDYDAGVRFLNLETLSPAVQNKAIQKARESYRLSPEQKTLLKTNFYLNSKK